MTRSIADTVIVGAPVYEGPGRPLRHDGLAVADGTVIAVGSAAEMRENIAQHTRVIHRADGLVVPGFQDAHVHPARGALAKSGCDLAPLATRDEYLAAIAAYVADHPSNEWISGRGWAPGAFSLGAPSKEDLDTVTDARPAFFVSEDGHSAWVNTAALRRAGIDATTPDPPHGQIVRSNTGEATGTLRETGNELIAKLLPPVTDAEWEAAILQAQQMLHGYGITAWQDAHTEPRDVTTYRSLKERGLLTAKVVGALWWERDRGIEQIEEFRAHRELPPLPGVSFNSVKMMLDGIIEGGTATLVEPYEGPFHDCDHGAPFLDTDDVLRYTIALDAAGFQVHYHAVGDAAVRAALDACAAARDRNGTRDSRHHIAHLELIHPDDIPRFAALGVVANIQPLWASVDTQMTELRVPALGAARSRWQFPFASLVQAGARLAGGSDWAVSTANPLPQMEVAVRRAIPGRVEAEPLFNQEALDIRTVLDAFTSGTAYVNFLDNSTGQLTPGRAADIAVLDRNILDCPPHEISDSSVVLTLADGQVVHAAADQISW